MQQKLIIFEVTSPALSTAAKRQSSPPRVTSSMMRMSTLRYFGWTAKKTVR